MTKITQEELDYILELHKLWLHNEPQGKRADLTCCDLSGADLSDVNLSGTDLISASLTHANLNGANLTCANFTNADLTGTKGLPTQEEVLDKLFEKTEEGYIVYKVFGMYYNPPKYWEIKEGSVIKEPVDMDRRRNCSYGINVSTVEWIEKDKGYYGQPIWKCLLKFEDLDRVCVPYGTDGKIRCGKLKLLEIIE